MAAISLEEEELLAAKVKQYPVLYDKQCKGYKERDHVANVWNAVAKELDFAENGLKAQSLFHTLKKKYQRKKRDLKESNKYGTSLEVVSKAKKAFQPYSFLIWLDDFFVTRQGKSNLQSIATSIEDEEEMLEYKELNVSSLQNCEGNTSILTGAPTFIKRPRNEPIRNRQWLEMKGSTSEILPDDTESPLIKENVSRKRKSQDEETPEDLFCKLLAADLKELPLYERLVARNEIREVMFKIQMSLMARKQSNSPKQSTHTTKTRFYDTNYNSQQQTPSFVTGGWTAHSSSMSSPKSTTSWDGM